MKEDEMTETTLKCTTRDGLFVEACDGLKEVTDMRASEGTRKGIVYWPMVNLETKEPSRTFYGVKSNKYPKGIVFNFCPFVGHRLMHLFMQNKERIEVVIHNNCQCIQCLRDRNEGAEFGGIFIPEEMQRMIVCQICGNKRCPHSTNHRNDCTGSNDNGQPGSIYTTSEPPNAG